MLPIQLYELLWMELGCLCSNNLVICNLLCCLPLNRASLPKQDCRQCLATAHALCTEDTALWREYFYTDELHERCMKSNLFVCEPTWCCPIWSTDPNSVDLFACQELPVLGVSLNLLNGEFSAHIVFYVGSFLLTFLCKSYFVWLSFLPKRE